MTKPAPTASSSAKFGSTGEEFLSGFQPWKPRERELLVVSGDIWNMHRTGTIVVTTNVGWDPVTLRNNMGAGLALQAAMRWPDLPRWYGEYCKNTAPDSPVVERRDLGIILFPVKPLLDPKDPERSWDQKAQLATIEKSLRELVALEGLSNVALTFPGCGNGGLTRAEVEPLLRRYLKDDRFVVCDETA